jgi:hypothetical protein
MDNTQSEGLRAEWQRLQAEHGDLLRRTQALQASGDSHALREHTQRLHTHVDQLHALMAALEEHHRTSGPVGGLTEK